MNTTEIGSTISDKAQDMGEIATKTRDKAIDLASTAISSLQQERKTWYQRPITRLVAIGATGIAAFTQREKIATATNQMKSKVSELVTGRTQDSITHQSIHEGTYETDTPGDTAAASTENTRTRTDLDSLTETVASETAATRETPPLPPAS